MYLHNCMYSERRSPPYVHTVIPMPYARVLPNSERSRARFDDFCPLRSVHRVNLAQAMQLLLLFHATHKIYW